jgi:hypothetical protein
MDVKKPPEGGFYFKSAAAYLEAAASAAEAAGAISEAAAAGAEASIAGAEASAAGAAGAAGSSFLPQAARAAAAIRAAIRSDLFMLITSVKETTITGNRGALRLISKQRSQVVKSRQ